MEPKPDVIEGRHFGMGIGNHFTYSLKQCPVLRGKPKPRLIAVVDY